MDLYCKYCGAELETDEQASCSACGRVQTEAPVAPPVSPSALQAENVGEQTEYAGILYDNIALNRQDAEAAEALIQEQAKKRRLPALAIGAAVVLVLAILAAGWFVTHRSTAAASGDMSAVVVQCEQMDFSLTNAELNYYYWSEYYYLISYYGDYLYYYTGIDTDTPLSEQTYSGEQSWEDYFISAAISSVEETMSFAFAAQEAGYALSGDYLTSLESTLESFETYALYYGFTDADGNADVLVYLQDSYGDGATYDSFVTYLTYSYLAAAYSNSLYYDRSFTDEEVNAYFILNEEEYAASGIDQTTRLVNIRHILLECDTSDEEEAAAVLAEAEALLAQFLEEDGTEEGFAALAEAYSEDPGSNTNGGLYEDVYPGEMVTNFNDWCFDADRQVGDTGIVETSYGYHIMYLSGFGEEYWYQTALEDLMYAAYVEAYTEILSRYTFTSDIESVCIATPAGQ